MGWGWGIGKVCHHGKANFVAFLNFKLKADPISWIVRVEEG
jgi:hypothetical protein